MNSIEELTGADEEVYTIPLGGRFRKKKSISEYLRIELDKRHPRFSEKNIVSKRYKISRKGICAVVKVKDGSVVWKGNRSWSVCSFILIVLCGLIMTGSLYIRKKGNKNSPEETQKESKVMNHSYPFPAEAADLILQRVYENNGSIGSFKWQEKSINVSISDCKPETVIFDKPCTVSYTNGSPSFNIELQVRKVKSNEGLMSFEGGEFHGEIRRTVTDWGALILQEKLSPVSSEFKYFISYESLRNCLKNIEEKLNEAFWHETCLTVESNVNGVLITCGFEKGTAQESSVSSLICSYLPVFKSVKTPAVAVIPKKTIVPPVRTIPAIQKEKLGAIRKNDGKVYTFWKYVDGRITSEEGESS